jgi:hypothetical protein
MAQNLILARDETTGQNGILNIADPTVTTQTGALKVFIANSSLTTSTSAGVAKVISDDIVGTVGTRVAVTAATYAPDHSSGNQFAKADAISMETKTKILITGAADKTDTVELYLAGFKTATSTEVIGFSSVSANVQAAPDGTSWHVSQLFENVGWKHVRIYINSASTAVLYIQAITF